MSSSTVPGKTQKLGIFKLRLFWKILIWFWLSSVLIITVNWFIVQLNSENIHFRPLPPPAENELQLTAKRVTRSLNNQENRRRSPSHFVNKRFHDIFLIDQQQNDYFGREIPEILADLNSRVIRHNSPLSAFSKRLVFFGGRVVEIKGISYRLYILRKDSFLDRHFVGGFFKGLIKNLFLTILLVGFPLSFFLSWLITKPIKKLQQATQDIKKDTANRINLEKLLKRSDEFGELARDFEDMSEHVDRMLSAQKQLLSDVSHELRSPLSRLIIAVGLVERKQMGGIEQDLNRIKRESNRMNEMLENLLTLSKLESQETDANYEVLDFCQLVKLVIEDGRFEAEQSNIKIELELLDNCQFKGSKEALLSGIENILRNAIKYAGEGGRILCQLEKHDHKLTFSVSDNGPGVPEQQLNKLFDAFYRPEFDRDRNTGGVGLGLSIAKRAFAINGGEIHAENVKPQGLKVQVDFCLGSSPSLSHQ